MPRIAPTPLHDPAAIFAAVRAREDQIVSLRSRFTAESRRADEHHTTTGVLLVKKPDRFRLRMLLPIGLTVFDYVRAGAHSQVSLPLQDRVIADPPPDGSLPFSQSDFSEAFLRGADAFPGACRVSLDQRDAIVRCSAAGQVLREVQIDPVTTTIRAEISYAAGQPRMIIRYDDYRPTGGTTLPYRITMEYPGRDLAVAIAVQRYEVNPTLSDELFRVVEP